MSLQFAILMNLRLLIFRVPLENHTILYLLFFQGIPKKLTKKMFCIDVEDIIKPQTLDMLGNGESW